MYLEKTHYYPVLAMGTTYILEEPSWRITMGSNILVSSLVAQKAYRTNNTF